MLYLLMWEGRVGRTFLNLVLHEVWLASRYGLCAFWEICHRYSLYRSTDGTQRLSEGFGDEIISLSLPKGL